ncbi:MAG: hypothetical protein HY688_05290 [Chloroflexi bacterium]|nr:hypothetical protein [Chloroflexota bacterium]
MRYDSAADRFVVRYRGQEAGAFQDRVAAVVVLRRGRRLLEEISHRLGLRRTAHTGI